jgi:hypothetical protein
MKKNVSPLMIGVAIVILAGFCYFMYRATQPNLQGPYDPRNGPPAYAKRGNMSGVTPQMPGQKPEQQPAPPGPK